MIDKRLEALNTPENFEYIEGVLSEKLPEWKNPQREDGTRDWDANRERSRIQQKQKLASQIKEVIDKRESISKLAEMIKALESKMTTDLGSIREYIEEHDLYGIVNFDPEVLMYGFANNDPIEDALNWMNSDHSC